MTLVVDGFLPEFDLLLLPSEIDAQIPRLAGISVLQGVKVDVG